MKAYTPGDNANCKCMRYRSTCRMHDTHVARTVHGYTWYSAITTSVLQCCAYKDIDEY